MTSRILPPEEWARLAACGIETANLDPERTMPIVVENDEADIVGCWLVMPVIHMEGLWIAPAYRQRTSVLRRLLQEMRQIVSGFFGVHVAWTAAQTPDVAAMIQAYGGAKLPPADHYVFPVRGA
jgi:hypothetical protein